MRDDATDVVVAGASLKLGREHLSTEGPPFKGEHGLMATRLRPPGQIARISALHLRPAAAQGGDHPADLPGEELARTRALFSQQEQELSRAGAKVDKLSRQLDNILPLGSSKIQEVQERHRKNVRNYKKEALHSQSQVSEISKKSSATSPTANAPPSRIPSSRAKSVDCRAKTPELPPKSYQKRYQQKNPAASSAPPSRFPPKPSSYVATLSARSISQPQGGPLLNIRRRVPFGTLQPTRNGDHSSTMVQTLNRTFKPSPLRPSPLVNSTPLRPPHKLPDRSEPKLPLSRTLASPDQSKSPNSFKRIPTSSVTSFKDPTPTTYITCEYYEPPSPQKTLTARSPNSSHSPLRASNYLGSKPITQSPNEIPGVNRKELTSSDTTPHRNMRSPNFSSASSKITQTHPKTIEATSCAPKKVPQRSNNIASPHKNSVQRSSCVPSRTAKSSSCNKSKEPTISQGPSSSSSNANASNGRTKNNSSKSSSLIASCCSFVNTSPISTPEKLTIEEQPDSFIQTESSVNNDVTRSTNVSALSAPSTGRLERSASLDSLNLPTSYPYLPPVTYGGLSRPSTHLPSEDAPIFIYENVPPMRRVISPPPVPHRYIRPKHPPLYHNTPGMLSGAYCPSQYRALYVPPYPHYGGVPKAHITEASPHFQSFIRPPKVYGKQHLEPAGIRPDTMYEQMNPLPQTLRPYSLRCQQSPHSPDSNAFLSHFSASNLPNSPPPNTIGQKMVSHLETGVTCSNENQHGAVDIDLIDFNPNNLQKPASLSKDCSRRSEIPSKHDEKYSNWSDHLSPPRPPSHNQIALQHDDTDNHQSKVCNRMLAAKVEEGVKEEKHTHDKHLPSSSHTQSYKSPCHESPNTENLLHIDVNNSSNAHKEISKPSQILNTYLDDLFDLEPYSNGETNKLSALPSPLGKNMTIKESVSESSCQPLTDSIIEVFENLGPTNSHAKKENDDKSNNFEESGMISRNVTSFDNEDNPSKGLEKNILSECSVSNSDELPEIAKTGSQASVKIETEHLDLADSNKNSHLSTDGNPSAARTSVKHAEISIGSKEMSNEGDKNASLNENLIKENIHKSLQSNISSSDPIYENLKDLSNMSFSSTENEEKMSNREDEVSDFHLCNLNQKNEDFIQLPTGDSYVLTRQALSDPHSNIASESCSTSSETSAGSLQEQNVIFGFNGHSMPPHCEEISPNKNVLSSHITHGHDPSSKHAAGMPLESLINDAQSLYKAERMTVSPSDSDTTSNDLSPCNSLDNCDIKVAETITSLTKENNLNLVNLNVTPNELDNGPFSANKTPSYVECSTSKAAEALRTFVPEIAPPKTWTGYAEIKTTGYVRSMPAVNNKNGVCYPPKRGGSLESSEDSMSTINSPPSSEEDFLSSSPEDLPVTTIGDIKDPLQYPTKHPGYFVPIPQVVKNKPKLIRNLTKGGERDKPLVKRVRFEPLALLLDAALEGELELVERLSSQVPDLNGANDEGVTALHNSICAGHVDVVKFLLQKGCDVNQADNDGWTPLHCAASCNDTNLAALLVQHGANLFATTMTDGDTPIQKAQGACRHYLNRVAREMGPQVWALYDHEALSSRELSVREGQRLHIVQRNDNGWWLCSDGTRSGFVLNTLLGVFPRTKSTTTTTATKS